jgi:hypothetical protein
MGANMPQLVFVHGVTHTHRHADYARAVANRKLYQELVLTASPSTSIHQCGENLLAKFPLRLSDKWISPHSH